MFRVNKEDSMNEGGGVVFLLLGRGRAVEKTEREEKNSLPKKGGKVGPWS